MRVLKARPRAPRVSVFLVLAACLAALVSLYCEETIPAATERATTEATEAPEEAQPAVPTDLSTDTATSTTTPALSDGTGTPGTVPTTAPPTAGPGGTPGGGTSEPAPATLAPAATTAPGGTGAPEPSATGQPGPTATRGPTSVVPVATPTAPSQTPGPTPTLADGSPTRTPTRFSTATSTPSSGPEATPTPTIPAGGQGPGPTATPTDTPVPPPTATPIPNLVEVLLIPETSESAPALLTADETMDFTVHVVTNGVKVSAVTVSIIFAPQVLEVVDALAPAGLQIEPHPDSPISQFVVANEVDNSAGTVRFTSGGITPTTEDFDLAIVTFRAKAAALDGNAALVVFLVDGGAETQAAYVGAPLLAKTANYVGAYILIQ